MKNAIGFAGLLIAALSGPAAGEPMELLLRSTAALSGSGYEPASPRGHSQRALEVFDRLSQEDHGNERRAYPRPDGTGGTIVYSAKRVPVGFIE